MTGTRCREKQDATHTPTGLEHVGGGVNGIKTDFKLSTLKGKKNTLFWGKHGEKCSFLRSRQVGVQRGNKGCDDATSRMDTS